MQHSQQQTPQLCNHRHVFNQRVESREEGALQVMGMPNIDRKTRRVVTTLKKTNNSSDATDNKERGGASLLAFMTTSIHEFSRKSRPHTKELSNKEGNKAGAGDSAESKQFPRSQFMSDPLETIK